MSINALEKALWQIYLNPADKQRFCSDARGYMQEFKVDEAERAMSTSFDVMAMIGHGVNPLLVMMAFQTIHGVEKLREYFAIVNQAGGGAGSAA
jgi:hypothetical protein